MTTATAIKEVTNQVFEVNPFNAPLGAEVVGIDLAKPLNSDDFNVIQQAFLTHHLLVFRDQQLTPEQHIDFSKRFGPLLVHVLKQFLLDNHPEIFIISNIVDKGKAIGLGDAGKFWHSDLSYIEKPSLGSMLYAREIPSVGGDTLYANMHLVWEHLPKALQTLVADKQAVHSYTATYSRPRNGEQWRPTLNEQQLAEVKEVVHPVVRTHPQTGRKALFVSESFTTRILGIPEDESVQILDELFAYSTLPEYAYRHRYQQDDLVFWDNRNLIHLAGGCPNHLPRRMYRTTIGGDKVF